MKQAEILLKKQKEEVDKSFDLTSSILELLKSKNVAFTRYVGAEDEEAVEKYHWTLERFNELKKQGDNLDDKINRETSEILDNKVKLEEELNMLKKDELLYVPQFWNSLFLNSYRID